MALRKVIKNPLIINRFFFSCTKKLGKSYTVLMLPPLPSSTNLGRKWDLTSSSYLSFSSNQQRPTTTTDAMALHTMRQIFPKKFEESYNFCFEYFHNCSGLETSHISLVLVWEVSWLLVLLIPMFTIVYVYHYVYICGVQPSADTSSSALME